MISPRPVVVDASLAIGLLFDEPEAPSIATSVTAWTRAGRPMFVPGHFWLEVVNRFARTSAMSGDRVLAAVHRLDRLGLQTIDVDRPLLVRVIDRIERHRLTAYDAVYLALAETLDADLATLDRTLATAAGPRAVTFDDDHRVHERPAQYEHEVTWPRYTEASAYLAKLRAETLAARVTAQAD
jgi:predicted nucleic acid-binding protein